MAGDVFFHCLVWVELGWLLLLGCLVVVAISLLDWLSNHGLRRFTSASKRPRSPENDFPESKRSSFVHFQA